MLGLTALARAPLGGSFGRSPAPGFQELITARSGSGAYLAEIDAYAGGDIRPGGSPLLGAGLLGETVLGGSAPDDGSGTGSGIRTLRLSDVGWCGRPTDKDRPNTLYEPRLSVPLSIERRIPTMPESSPRIGRQIGDIEFDNADGAYDAAAASWAVDGRTVRIYFGPEVADFADFGLIAELLGSGWKISERSVRLSVKDRRYALDRPVQSRLYDGSGGAEGPADLKGKPRPMCWGKVRNIAPTLVDATNLIYEFHSRRAHAVDAVYDRGLALTDSGGTAIDFTALQALPVPAGRFAVSFSAEGSYIKLGSSPGGLVTADVRGDATNGYADTVDVLAQRILRVEAGMPEAVINTSSWSSLVAAGGVIGLYLDQSEIRTTASVIDILVQSVGGFWGAGRDGRVRAGRLTAPEDRTPVFFVNDYDVLDVDTEEAPLPRYRERVGYRRRWTTQTEDIAGGIADVRRQFLAERFSAVTALDTAIRVRHPEAMDPPPLVSLYDDEADAQTLADTLLALHKVDRQRLSITVKRVGYLLDLGQVISVTYPRLGLSGGKRFIVVGIREEASRDEQTITLWG